MKDELPLLQHFKRLHIFYEREVSYLPVEENPIEQLPWILALRCEIETAIQTITEQCIRLDALRKNPLLFSELKISFEELLPDLIRRIQESHTIIDEKIDRSHEDG